MMSKLIKVDYYRRGARRAAHPIHTINKMARDYSQTLEHRKHLKTRDLLIKTKELEREEPK
ncbi:hypothetical protein, partial [Vibrio mediterranei]|uniref:hypothetical protein n=1 Tax=Vibrio mediterranei TaxID=689 RepID=UPI001EFD2C78